MTPLEQINWTSECMGAGVKLGHIDGWPSATHPDLVGQFTVSNLLRATNNPYSHTADHASATVGVAAGKKEGVARGAHILSVPVFNAADGVVWYSIYRNRSLKTCYTHFVTNGVKCVNRELSVARSPWPGDESIWGTGDLDLVANYPQMVHVQAAGNRGVALATQPFGRPASALDHLLIVGAVDSRNQISPGSNTPQRRFLFKSPYPVKEEDMLSRMFVCAPGVAIHTPTSPDGYVYWSGTSFAVCFVEGLVALMYEKVPSLTPQACVRIIKETCTKIGPPEIYGHGLINVKAALAVTK